MTSARYLPSRLQNSYLVTGIADGQAYVNWALSRTGKWDGTLPKERRSLLSWTLRVSSPGKPKIHLNKRMHITWRRWWVQVSLLLTNIKTSWWKRTSTWTSRKFHLSSKKKFFNLRVKELWNRLPSEGVESYSLEIFGIHLDFFLWILL